MSKKYLFVFVFVILFGNVLADFQTGEEGISENYAVGGEISGWIEFEFTNQDSSAKFTDSFGNSITLKELLEKSSYPYECENNCFITYTSTNAQNTKTFPLSMEEEKVVGIRYIGRNVEPLKISFNVSSDVVQSDENQLEIDLLADGVIDFGNINLGTSFATTELSCFNKNNQDMI